MTCLSAIRFSMVHLSDPHFGDCDEPTVERLVQAVARIQPDLVAVTGDLTQSGRVREFRQAAAFLQRLGPQVVVVPGNHDVSVFNPQERMLAPWRRFRYWINPDLNPALTRPGLRLVCLNSARRAGWSRDWSLGRLSQAQVERARASFEAKGPRDLAVLGLHHPLVAGPGPAGDAILRYPKNLLATLSTLGCDLVLCGHVHRAQLSLVESPEASLIVVTAGTASSKRLRGGPASFNRIVWDGSLLVVEVFQDTGSEFVCDSLTRLVRNGAQWSKQEGVPDAGAATH